MFRYLDPYPCLILCRVLTLILTMRRMLRVPVYFNGLEVWIIPLIQMIRQFPGQMESPIHYNLPMPESISFFKLLQLHLWALLREVPYRVPLWQLVRLFQILHLQT